MTAYVPQPYNARLDQAIIQGDLIAGDGIVIDGVPGSGADPFASLIVAGSGISVAYNSGLRVWTISNIGGGGGTPLTVREVDGSPSATVSEIVFPNGTVSIVSGVATITGLQGPQGPQGPQGNPGDDGADGADGADGVDGADGADGAAGPNLVSTTTATDITGPIVGNGTTIIAGSFGTTAGTFCEGNDSRLSDARTPVAHNHAASEITSGTLDPARLSLTKAQLNSVVSDGDVLYVGDVTSGVGGSTGATDNRLLRSDGTGGATLQNTGITVDDSNNVTGVGSLTAAVNSGSGNFAAHLRQDGIGSILRLQRNNGGASGDYIQCDNGTNAFAVNRDGVVFTSNLYRSSRFNSAQYTTGNEDSTGWGSTGFNSKNIVGYCDNAEVVRFTTSGASITGNLTASGLITLGTYTVGTLPSASANTRARAFATDSSLAFNSTNLGSTVTGGGANLVPVFSNGTNWVIG